MNAKNDFHDLERHLRHTLQSLQPHDSFVAQVKNRFHEPSVSLRQKKIDSAARFALLGGGALSGLVLALMVARILFYISGLSKKSAL